ncbi:armadillo-type protein [Lyophyllum atratum]|nr:armadillo-type protein [Lyophyllum atratum]
MKSAHFLTTSLCNASIWRRHFQSYARGLWELLSVSSLPPPPLRSGPSQCPGRSIYLLLVPSSFTLILCSTQGYQRADLITSEDLTLIKKVDKQPRARIESILLSDGPTYALLYFRLLKKLQRVDTMQCLLVLIADALTDHEERIPVFLKTADADPDLPFLPLLRILDTQDEFVQLKAAQILTILISSPLTPAAAVWSVPGIIVGYASIFSSEVLALTPHPDLLEILKHKPGPQMSYQVALCFWLLSFEQNVAEELNKKYDVIPLLINVAQEAVKEKVIRVIVATFRNLVAKAPAANLPAMLVAQLLPFVKNLSTRKWQDDDVLEDVKFLRDELNANFQILTTYDKYTSELSSGHLSWTPVHESESFWKENAARLNDNDCEQLKTLLRLLKESSDPLVLAVAAHDVGQLVTDLSGKERVMELMTHEDSDVRYRALMTVQQLVSQPWRVV